MDGFVLSFAFKEVARGGVLGRSIVVLDRLGRADLLLERCQLCLGLTRLRAVFHALDDEHECGRSQRRRGVKLNMEFRFELM